MKKKKRRTLLSIVTALALSCMVLIGCDARQSDQVSYNISQEADNFNVTRRLTVFNARTDTVLMQMEGTFALDNNSNSELEIICEVGEGKYQKHFVYLNDDTLYVVEDISGADVDKYHYELNFLPEWGINITHKD